LIDDTGAGMSFDAVRFDLRTWRPVYWRVS